MPTVIGSPTRSRTAERNRAAICTGVPDTRQQAGDVEERLVDAQRLDDRAWCRRNTSNTASLASEYADIRGGTTMACGHSCARLAAAHRGAHAVGLGLVAGGEHDAAADDHRPSAQRGIVALLDRRVERIEISVQDARRTAGHEHMFASRSD